MILYNIFERIVWYYITVSQCTQVLCQICVEKNMSYRDVPETYLYTYMEAYEKSNCLFWCIDTRVATAVGTRNVQKLIEEQINVCCEGYTKDEDNDDNSIHCKPICSPACINGYCISPGVCACNPGYIPDVFDTYKCSPLCINGCEHGTCTAPNTCQCDFKYDLMNGKCEPICSEPCHNGMCVAPETCDCLPGYKKSENNTCDPYCSSYTASGECNNIITCAPGWMKVSKGLVEVCEPVCLEPCVSGTCVAPETCECFNGYIKSPNDTCEPHCSSGCLHGSCIGPETCICEPGWYRKESEGACLAHCDYKCGNGTCVARNVCECFSGFELDKFDQEQEKDTALCVPSCRNCEGSCVSPGKCVCEPPQETMLVGLDGGPCDCIDNCSDDENKCERTICFITTTSASLTTFPLDEIVEDITVSINTISTTDVQEDTTIDYSPSNYYKLKIDKTSWFNSNWFYAIGSTILLTIIILIAAVMKRKYLKSFSRNIFSRHISDDDILTAVHYKQNNGTVC